jgi:hypothetical protein
MRIPPGIQALYIGPGEVHSRRAWIFVGRKGHVQGLLVERSDRGRENLWLRFFDRDLHGTEMTDFMVEFTRYVSSGENHRKIWSHHSILYAWSANDPRTRFTWTRHPASPRDTAAEGQWTFDPTNRIYGKVMNEICPDLSARLVWQHAASDETCGDCIEALLGVWMHCAAPGWAPYHDERRPTANCVVLNRAARCWEQMSYRAYRIFRMLDWYRCTHVVRQGAGLRIYSNRERAIMQEAINWAGPYYTPIGPPHQHNVPQPTRLLPQP